MALVLFDYALLLYRRGRVLYGEFGEELRGIYTDIVSYNILDKDGNVVERSSVSNGFSHTGFKGSTRFGVNGHLTIGTFDRRSQYSFTCGKI